MFKGINYHVDDIIYYGIWYFWLIKHNDKFFSVTLFDNEIKSIEYIPLYLFLNI